MNFRGFDLSGNNLTLYEGSTLMPNHIVLNAHGTLDDCLPREDNSPIVLLANSATARMPGLGFLKGDRIYEHGKTVSLDDITAIAGYGTTALWEDFARSVKLQKLEEMARTVSERIVLK